MTPVMKKTVISLGIGAIIGFSPLRNSGLAKFMIAISGG